MHKPQGFRMKHHGIHGPFFVEKSILFVTAVRTIANNWVKNMGHMFSDLVKATGFWMNLD
jgi:hypothetical protein